MYVQTGTTAYSHYGGVFVSFPVSNSFYYSSLGMKIMAISERGLNEAEIRYADYHDKVQTNETEVEHTPICQSPRYCVMRISLMGGLYAH